MTNDFDVAGDPKTFDIAAVLQGRTYPEVEVPFYLDESAALAVSKAERELTVLSALGKSDEYDALEKRLQEMLDTIQQARYTITLRGLSNKHRQDLIDESLVAFPRPKEAMFGVEVPNEQREQHFSNLLLHAMTVKIQNPEGAVQVHPSMEIIEQFRAYAPQVAMDAVWEGVRELADGVKSGFERAAQETDFLSKP